MTKKSAESWFNEGYDWYNKQDYDKAIECYQKAIELNPDNANAYHGMGVAYEYKQDYDKAIECYQKAIELNPKDAVAYYNMGNAYYNKQDYDKAIECYQKAIELNPKDAVAYYNMGNAYYNKQDYEKAIEWYEKAIKISPKYADAYNNMGNAYYNTQNYDKAIECYEKTIEIDPKHTYVYYNIGNAYKNGKQDYEKAIECYEKAIEINPDYAKAKSSKEVVLRILKEKKQDKDFGKKIEDTYLSLYDLDFFNETTQDIPDEEKESYNDIYYHSLKILKELQIKDDIHETSVAHYTSKKVAQILFFDKKGEEKEDDKDKKPIPLRLTSVTNSNDTQEGKTLFNYLFNNQKMEPQPEQFVAFVACFMFNHDSLNQFRLYGKDENNTEGTGISIVMKPDFFSSKSKSPIQQEGKNISDDDDNKEPLFRCIYIDPDTNQVISVGHKDHHTFYRTKEILYNREVALDFIEKKRDEIKEYRTSIDEKIDRVEKLLEDLKSLVSKPELNYQVVCNLLLNLRYLVKHVAFKEEQECRIVKIKKPFEANNDVQKEPIDENHERFYVDYLPINNCVSNVYFGPKASGLELFQSLLTYQKDFKGVVCSRSTSPLAAADKPNGNS